MPEPLLEPASLSPATLHPTVRALGWVSLFADLASKMVYPVTPLFLTAVLGAPVWTVGVIEGFAESAASLLKLYSGRLSDQAGQRKPYALAGYSLGAVSKLGLALSGGWAAVLSARLLDRVGKGLRAAPRDALIAENCACHQRGQAYGLHHSLETVGEVLGPLVGFFFLLRYEGHYRGLFVLAFVPALVSVLVLLKYVKEPKRITITQNSQLPKFTFRGLTPAYQQYLGVVGLFGLGNSSDAFLLVRSQDLGFRGSQLLLLYALFNLMSVVLGVTIGKLSDRVGRRVLLVMGYGLFALVYLGFALVQAPAFIWILFIFYGLYTALTRGVQKALVADLVHADRRGAEIGAFHMLVGLAALPASLIAGFLYTQVGVSVPFYFSAAISAIASILLWQLRLPTTNSS
ncbi:MAG: Arabinose efflux permease [Phormidesmis priestleyi Ana]|uniref:Arabinose efflux permease n=1 Tax=Phormidesmis priestleyi Ana TaxID=1666911 RepID=A0A0P7ZNF7_9CYAN|nr:MAG: Arabinose efflux permease [Phormidesmis priestleyi Ana]